MYCNFISPNGVIKIAYFIIKTAFFENLMLNYIIKEINNDMSDVSTVNNIEAMHMLKFKKNIRFQEKRFNVFGENDFLNLKEFRK